MADDDGKETPLEPPGPRLIQFPRPKSPPPLPAFVSGDKLGLYPLGTGEDVVMGRALFGLIITMLENPTANPEDRERLIKMLKAAYSAPFVP